MARDPGASYASDTRQLVRQDRLSSGRGGGPPGVVVLGVILAIAAAVVYFVAFR